jgi:aspartyl-tRNA(Asn)/glutamyl-tRNA(Gln) amidotransferase subunit A
MQSRWDDYFAATRVGVSRAVFASGADYVQAQRVRRLAKGRVAEMFKTVDIIVGPTSATAASSYDDLPGRMLESAMRLSFTSYWNAVGHPALVVPMGFNAAGLPLSLQIAGRPFDEATILAAGDAYQRVTDWHLRVAPLITSAPAPA